jgi:hypothetical protein
MSGAAGVPSSRIYSRTPSSSECRSSIPQVSGSNPEGRTPRGALGPGKRPDQNPFPQLRLPRLSAVVRARTRTPRSSAVIGGRLAASGTDCDNASRACAMKRSRSLGGMLVAERHLRRGPSAPGHHLLGGSTGRGRHGAGEVSQIVEPQGSQPHFLPGAPRVATMPHTETIGAVHRPPWRRPDAAIVPTPPPGRGCPPGHEIHGSVK